MFPVDSGAGVPGRSVGQAAPEWQHCLPTLCTVQLAVDLNEKVRIGFLMYFTFLVLVNILSAVFSMTPRLIWKMSQAPQARLYKIFFCRVIFFSCT